MGTCFPNAILGEGGYLATHQNSLRKLPLITDGNCITESPPLNEFENIRELSWKGLRTDGDCAALKGFLELHHERLASLEVDFVDWAGIESYFDLSDDSEDEDDKSTPLTDLIVPEREADYGGFLPNLQTFSLSAASFKGSWDCLIDAFNLCHVEELRLLNCKVAVELLYYMARTNVSLQATNVELVLPRSEIHSLEFELIDFLAPFDSLENLFLMFESDYADECYAEMILHHRDTLRRLVFHRRYYCLDEKAPYWEEYCDSSLEETEGGGFADINRKTKLESVGVCGEPSKLQKSFQSIASTVNSLTLLHLRFTRKAERKPNYSNNLKPTTRHLRDSIELILKHKEMGPLHPNALPVLVTLKFGSDGKKSKARTGVKMKKRSWKLSQIGHLVPMDSHVSRFLPLVTFPMAIVLLKRTRSGAGIAAAPGAKRHGARSNRATLPKTS